MKTADEIKTEIETLRAMKPKVRRTSHFGDNNHNAIEAQIEVLTDNLSDDDIYDKEENEEWMENEKDSALEARQWMDGESEDKPSDGWKPLMK